MIGWLILAVVAGAALVVWRVNASIARNLPRPGDPAPVFTLPDQNGASRTLEDFRGRWLVLYFYPRDDTPGCAEQAMRFRHAMHDLEALGAAVCGVSVDSSDSHAAFALKYKLPFALLADRNGETAARFGSLRNFGLFRFAKRNTFLIDPSGKVAKVYVGVNAGRNAQEVSADLAQLQ
ncbi:MAG TPA: peroxiredoxin [Burkholderiales bacterium]|jgi:peroxiredoxin Q/BCP|nr:peroxiredoxin [Burkholderiales bacterium]